MHGLDAARVSQNADCGLRGGPHLSATPLCLRSDGSPLLPPRIPLAPRRLLELEAHAVLAGTHISHPDSSALLLRCSPIAIGTAACTCAAPRTCILNGAESGHRQRQPDDVQEQREVRSHDMTDMWSFCQERSVASLCLRHCTSIVPPPGRR